MKQIEQEIKWLSQNINNMRFADLCKICNQYFGEPRQKGSSHVVYKTVWQGDPRINIQNDKGKAKPYQVRQVIKALKKLERM